MDDAGSIHVLRAGGSGDPDAARAARILHAHLSADQALTFRNQVWTDATVVAIFGLLIADLGWLSPAGFARGLCALATIATAAGVRELYTRRKVAGLLD